MKQQFVGLKHCKCGISWKKDIGYFERTNNMVFALQRRKIGKKTKQVPVIRFRGESKCEPQFIDQDDQFFYIAGYTSGGAPYGVTWQEMGLEPYGDVDAADSELDQ